MRSPCCLCVCVSTLIFSFSVQSLSYQREVGDQFFPQLLAVSNIHALGENLLVCCHCYWNRKDQHSRLFTTKTSTHSLHSANYSVTFNTKNFCCYFLKQIHMQTNYMVQLLHCAVYNWYRYPLLYKQSKGLMLCSQKIASVPILGQLSSLHLHILFF
jgi:hypothetical protein